MRVAWIVLGLVACGATPRAPTVATATATASVPVDAGAPTDDAPLADAATWEKWKSADYVVFAPSRFRSALAPLVRHREASGRVVATLDVEPLFARFTKGRRDARALKEAATRLVAHAKKLRFVLLVGDVDHPNDDTPDVPVPTFYAKKMDYEHHRPGEHTATPGYVTQREHAKYPTDHPLETVAGVRLAVGRIPARTEEQLRAVIKKIVDYETSEPDGAWRRKVDVFTGPANYGPTVDAVIETIASHILDDELSYDYDVDFTFAKPDSPYAVRPDKLREHFVSELGAGALVAAYVGHGAVASFDHVYARGQYWEIGTSEDAAALRIAAGRPVFFSFACDTGAYDRPAGRASIAEQMILNPGGPVAVFASSRESHPYTNALYAAAVVKRFLGDRPATLGEGILAIKDAMRDSSMAGAELLVDVDIAALKREHEGLYSLLGDPAMRLRFPDAATVTVSPAKPGDEVAIGIASPVSGSALVTIETQRSVIRGALVPPSTLDAMTREQAFAAMEENRKKSTDKVVTRATAPLAGGRASVTMRAPSEPGAYVVKVIVVGASGVAAGHAALRVAR